MATTLMPVDPQTSPMRATGLLAVAANLLPDEVVAARRARRARSAVVGAVVVVALLLGGWYMYARNETSIAERELTEVQDQVAAQKRKQNEYREVVSVQQEADTIAGQLKTVMATDLPYATLVDSLRDTATATEVVVTGITARLDDAPAKGTTAQAATSTSVTMGGLEITGTAKDKNAVARYADALGKVPNVVNPFVTNVATSGNSVQFSLTAQISGTAKCGRFTTACKSTGGN
ncbi:fimbrial assembly protein PilN [Krasilnikovia cinnamomea]|uniref:Fimbrial assembly protein PilN n=1 Tax=Krasilnikovia cinnamomea TaxID=349313 RepID=A0A4Q7ZMK6_9ACTN|nr:PilN domain-containing protein [Krasilnikovia cinnamomea]RZU52242.1 fimbrial assembly protein PilN [Krasilnikovia cinnamomea]